MALDPSMVVMPRNQTKPNILLTTFLNEIFFLHTVKWFQVLLYESQFNISQLFTQSCSIGPIDRTLSCATTLGQSGPGSNGNERILQIPQISKTAASYQMV